MSEAPNVFLSHASKDATLAQRLCVALELRGVRCWIAPRDVNPGRAYADEIVRGIEGCGSFVLIATADAIASRNVMNELEQAHRTNRAIYTLMVGQPKLTGEISYYIARLHWLESTEDKLEESAERLSEVLHGALRWEAVAAAPSLTRRLRYAMPAFAGAMSAILISFVVLAALALHAFKRVRHNVATHYTSLGWTKLYATGSAADRPVEITGHVFLGDAGLSFSKIHLNVLSEDHIGKTQALDLTPMLPKETTGDTSVNFPLPSGLEKLQTFLVIPASTGQFCVEQAFQFQTGTLHESGEPWVKEIVRPDQCK